MAMAFLTFPEECRSAIQRLTADTPAQWGLMNAQQMVEHLLIVVRLSYGSIAGKVMTPGEEWAQRKEFLHNSKPFAQNLRNPALPAEPRPVYFSTFAEAVSQLHHHIHQAEAAWQAAPEATYPHPLFGPLTPHEWRQFHSKHFTHHLRQFGLVAGS